MVPPGQWGSTVSLESMQTDTPLVREALVLARHFIEAHLGTELFGSEVILAVLDPVFIEGVPSQGSHRGPLSITLLFTPRIRPLPLVRRILASRICVEIVSLPGITLTQEMYRR